ncbi:MAG: hypothetical protein JXB47_00215 [Anaerolineae bacterium]|nr:hypothetical protein [Anaerolineae bacterium]
MNVRRPPQGRYRKVPDGHVLPVYREGMFSRLLEPGEAPNRFRGEIPGLLIDISPKFYKLIFMDLSTQDHQLLSVTLTIEYGFDPRKLPRDAIVDEIARPDKERQHIVFAQIQRVLRDLVSQYSAEVLEANPSAGSLERSIYLRIYRPLLKKGIALGGQESINVLEVQRPPTIETGAASQPPQQAQTPAQDAGEPEPEPVGFHAPPPSPAGGATFERRSNDEAPDETETDIPSEPEPSGRALPGGRRIHEAQDAKTRAEEPQAEEEEEVLTETRPDIPFEPGSSVLPPLPEEPRERAAPPRPDVVSDERRSRPIPVDRLRPRPVNAETQPANEQAEATADDSSGEPASRDTDQRQVEIVEEEAREKEPPVGRPDVLQNERRRRPIPPDRLR